MKYLLVVFSILVITASCKKSEEVRPKVAVLFQDKLFTDQGKWYVGSNGDYEFEFEQGGYTVKTNNAGTFRYTIAPYKMVARPYILSVDVTTLLENTFQRGYVGFVFNRSGDSNYSLFCIYTNGTYGIWKYDGEFTTIIYPTYTAAIRTGSGSKNTISLAQNNTHVTVQVNNTMLGTYALPLPPTSSSVGLMSGTMDVSSSRFTPVTGIFNNFIIASNPY